MGKFRVKYKSLTESVTITNSVISNLVLENNNFFKSSRDLFTGDLYIYCENKPEDSKILGIFFEEVESRK